MYEAMVQAQTSHVPAAGRAALSGLREVASVLSEALSTPADWKVGLSQATTTNTKTLDNQHEMMYVMSHYDCLSLREEC